MTFRVQHQPVFYSTSVDVKFTSTLTGLIEEAAEFPHAICAACFCNCMLENLNV